MPTVQARETWELGYCTRRAELRRLDSAERNAPPFDGAYCVAVGDVLDTTPEQRMLEDSHTIYRTRADALAAYEGILEQVRASELRRAAAPGDVVVCECPGHACHGAEGSTAYRARCPFDAFGLRA